MLRRFALLGCLAASACGGEGSWQRCSSNAECPAGTFCSVPVSGEKGVCQAPGTLVLAAPAAGAYVGTNASFTATLTLAAAGFNAPATVDLRLGGTTVTALGLQGVAGLVATYGGTWTASAAQNGPGSLDASASVGVSGTSVPVTSAPVAVTLDTLRPVIQAPTSACAGGCRRDSAMAVSADVTDANILAVTVSLDLDPSRLVPVTRNGSVYSASVALADWPFPYFARPVNVTIRAVDRAGNEATSVVPVDVTRLRWAYTSGAAAVTSPAIMANGTIVFGVSATSGQLRALNPDMTEAFPPVTLGNQAVTAAPSIGPTAIWVASNDGKIYAVARDGSGILNGAGCDTLSAPVGVPALSLGASELSFTGSTTTKALFSARVAGPLCNGTTIGEAFVASAAVNQTGHILAATASAAGAQSVRRLTDPGTGLPSPDWAVSSGLGTDVPLALDGSSRVLASSFDASLYRVTDNGGSGTAALLATLTGRPAASPIVLSSGDIVVGTVGGRLHRLSDTGADVWTPAPDLVGDITGVVAAAAGAPTDPTVLAVTALGKVFAIRADGSEAWSGQVASGPLRPPVIVPGATGGLPTLYAGSANGTLYSVVVDTGPDTTAPWPKAYHDARNTGNAGSPLP